MEVELRSNRTWLIFLCTMILVTLGIVMVYSSSAAIAAKDLHQREAAAALGGGDEFGDPGASIHSYHYLRRQVMWVGFGLVALTVAYLFDYDRTRKLAVPLMLLSLVLVVAVLIPGIGVMKNGARRWLGFGPMQFQASEFAKLALVIYMAKKMSDNPARLRQFLTGFFPLLCLLGVFALLIVVEPDLGAAAVIGLIVFTMMFAAGARLVHLGTLVLVGVAFIVVAIIVEPYRVARFFAYLNPESDIHGKTWQIYQSLVTIGSGGVTGLGVGQGPQKHLFLSEAYTDFIFAIICEETGLIGASLVAALYVFFTVQGVRVALAATSPYARLLAVGTTMMIAIPAFINMGVVTGLLPTKGLTLPLISYGGSSLIFNMAAVGLLMNVSRAVEIESVPVRRLRPVYG